MIKKIKNYFKSLRSDVKKINYSQNQQWATQKLQALFAADHFIPQTGWSMTPQAIIHTLNIVSLAKPNAIIEFGSGATTLYIAKLLKLEGSKAHFYSVESSLEWKKTIENQLEGHGLQDYVHIIHAPLEDVSPGLQFKEQVTWYATECIMQAIVDVESFDLVVVDGPYGGGTPFARYSAFPFLNEKTGKETIWLLDDTNRAQEFEILNEWQRQSGLNRRSFRRYSLLMPNAVLDYTPYRMQ